MMRHYKEIRNESYKLKISHDREKVLNINDTYVFYVCSLICKCKLYVYMYIRDTFVCSYVRTCVCIFHVHRYAYTYVHKSI
jgi:hypothetical protein